MVERYQNEDNTLKIATIMKFAAKPSPRGLLVGFAAGLTLASLPAGAQQVQSKASFQAATAYPHTFMLASVTLPDSPGAVLAGDMGTSSSISRSEGVDFAAPTSTTPSMASPTDKYIAPGQPVPTLTVGNKVLLGIKDAASPLSGIGWLLSAGYEQATNGSPNYGTNSTAFGKRFGAAAARSSSEGIFSDSVLASVLREDPRYYRMGSGHNILKRAAYAATRTLITRTDSGRTSPNFALLGGNLGGSYLTKVYYPTLNQTNTEVLKTFGGSLGGSAIGLVASEFLSGAFNIFHNSRAAAN